MSITFFIYVKKKLTVIAFFEGLQLVDGILIANELVDDAKRRKK